VEGRGEVCLAEEAERLRRSGLRIDEVARRMGVDAAWVESVVAEPEGNEESTPEEG
jgi:predicted transposase YdaD